ncbi:unnamed protein product [Allacma fusca]|uniref:Uncharacterized protein n=1 Tax=Allacma fusca TaxID=39272 RepID=A0A8J2PHK5_9HEXA|nr:unnamed protein product [Allacma fusca]
MRLPKLVAVTIVSICHGQPSFQTTCASCGLWLRLFYFSHPMVVVISNYFRICDHRTYPPSPVDSRKVNKFCHFVLSGVPEVCCENDTCSVVQVMRPVFPSKRNRKAAGHRYHLETPPQLELTPLLLKTK